jgi:DNA-binding transcriptional MocR family regulator
LLASGKYRKHTERVRDRLARVRASSTSALRRAGLDFESAGTDGIFLWCRLPPRVQPEQLFVEARAAGILLAKGSLFSISGKGDEYVRINAAYGSEPALTHFLGVRCAA